MKYRKVIGLAEIRIEDTFAKRFANKTFAIAFNTKQAFFTNVADVNKYLEEEFDQEVSGYNKSATCSHACFLRANSLLINNLYPQLAITDSENIKALNVVVNDHLSIYYVPIKQTILVSDDM